MLITSWEIKFLHTRPASVPLMSIHTTEQPAEANACAVASPRPLPAPVTRTIFPFNLSIFIQYSLHVSYQGQRPARSWFDGFDRVHIKFLYEFAEKFDCIT